MTIVSPMGQLRPVFADKNGKRLSGGKVFTYEPGTLTPKATYTDALNLIPNTNPINLDESGEADIYLDGDCRVMVYSRHGVLIHDVDNFKTWVTRDALNNIPHNNLKDRDVAGAHPASAILDASGKTQQEINDAIIDPDTGKAVASKVYDASGKTQQEINSGISITTLLNIQNPTSSMRFYVSEGVKSGWFKYTPSLVAVSDGGTVFNGWERIDYNAITFDMFGMDNTGSIAVDSKLLNVFAAQKRTGKPIHNFSGTYLLNSNEVFKISENTFLDGTTFKLGANFSGYFTLDRGTETATYDDTSSLVTTMKSGGVLQKGAMTFGALASNTELNDSIIEISVNQPMYIYQGITQNRYELQRMYKMGEFSDPLYYSLDSSLITEVKKQALHTDVLLVSGFAVDESITSASYIFRPTHTNTFVIRNFRFTDKSSSPRTTNQVRVYLQNCHNFVIDGISTSGAVQNTGGDYNYTLQMDNCYNPLVIGIDADGEGWGVVGTNNCKNVTFEKCKVSRIDAHKPIHNYLKVNNCAIGAWGFIVTMLGDLFINNVDINQRETESSPGFIRSRSDTGGWCDGDLYINELRLNGKPSVSIPFIRCGHDGVMPSGSPVNATMFNRIFVDGLYNNIATNPITSFISRSVSTLCKFPKNISIENATQSVNSNLLDFSVGEFAEPSGQARIILQDIEANQVRLTNLATPKTTKVNLVIRDAVPVSTNGVLVQNQCDGSVIIDDVSLLRYSEAFGAGYTPFLPKVKINKSYLNDDLLADVSATAKPRIKVRNCDFKVNSFYDAKLNMNKYSFADCEFQSENGISLFNGSSINTGNLSINTVGNIRLQIRSTVSGNIAIDELVLDMSTSKTVTFPSGSIVITAGSPMGTIAVSASSGVINRVFVIAN